LAESFKFTDKLASNPAEITSGTAESDKSLVRPLRIDALEQARLRALRRIEQVGGVGRSNGFL
jgi:hypothetical protein